MGRAPSAQPNAVGPAGSTLRPGSVDRPGHRRSNQLRGQPNSAERPNSAEQSKPAERLNSAEQSKSPERSNSVDRPGPGSENAALPLPSTIRRTPSPPINPSHGSGPVTSLESPGDGASLGADQPGNAVGFSPEVTHGPGTSARSLDVVGGRAGMRLRRSAGANPLLLPRAVVGLPGALPSPGPVAPIGSGPARLPVGTAAPQFISPREVRESLRPPATTGYLTARRQRWGLGGSHVVPALSTLAATRHARGTGQVAVVRTTVDPGLGDRGHRGRTPTRAPSIAGPTVEPGQPGPSAAKQANADRRPAMSQPVSGDAASPEAGGSQRVAARSGPPPRHRCG